MKRTILGLTIGLLAGVTAIQAQVEVAGDVSGEWTADRAPYIATADIRVPAGEELVIRPGVQVLFAGNFRLLVNGRIRALGEEGNRISFDSRDGRTRWHGVRVINADGDNQFVYCYFHLAAQTANYPEQDSHGGAMYGNSSQITITNCEFDDNRASGMGGAACFEEGATGDITGSWFHDNDGYSLIISQLDAELNFRNNLVENNIGNYGAGLFLDGSSAAVENNIIRGNNSRTMTWGCGLYLVHRCASVVRNNLIVNNNRGGVYIGYGADPEVFERNTIANNPNGPGVFMVNGGRLTARDCIFWGQPTDIAFSDGSATVSYSDGHEMGGIQEGEGLIDQDPRFVDPNNGDYRLQNNSPCRDTGDPDSPADPDGTRADMGYLHPIELRLTTDADTLAFGVVARGVEVSESMRFCYLSGPEAVQELVVAISTPAEDNWLSVGPNEAWMEQGDTIDVTVSILPPEETEPGNYQSRVRFVPLDYENSSITVTVTCRVVAGFGNIGGNVFDPVSGAGIPGAVVTFEGTPVELTTNDNGEFMYEHCPSARLRLSVQHPDYRSYLSAPFDLAPGADEFLQIPLLYATCNPTPSEIEVGIPQRESAENSINLANTGSADLQYSAECLIPSLAGVDLYEKRLSIPVEEVTGDNRIQGVEFVEDKFYVTGGASGRGRGKVYIFDRNGEFEDSFDQFIESSWGMRDLAWDGELLWGADGLTMCGFTPQGALVRTFQGPVNLMRAVAWDPDDGALWVCDLASTLYSMDREGNVIESFARPGPRTCGLAWYADDPDGQKLYLFTSDAENAAAVQKFNPANRRLTFLSRLNDRAGGVGGACMTTAWDPLSVVMAGVVRSDPTELDSLDQIEIYQLSSRTDWLRVTPMEGTIPAATGTTLQVSLRSLNLPIGVYEAELRITHDGRGGVTTVPLTMTLVANGVRSETAQRIPSAYRLSPPSPNPFNSATTLAYDLPEAGLVSLTITDLTGRTIAKLVNGRLSAGSYRVVWRPDSASTGLYLATLRVGDFKVTERVILIK